MSTSRFGDFSVQSLTMGALTLHEQEAAAAVTFLFAASGPAFLGVGSAFRGLLAGGGMVLFKRWRHSSPEYS